MLAEQAGTGYLPTIRRKALRKKNLHEDETNAHSSVHRWVRFEARLGVLFVLAPDEP